MSNIHNMINAIVKVVRKDALTIYIYEDPQGHFTQIVIDDSEAKSIIEMTRFCLPLARPVSQSRSNRLLEGFINGGGGYGLRYSSEQEIPQLKHSILDVFHVLSIQRLRYNISGLIELRIQTGIRDGCIIHLSVSELIDRHIPSEFHKYPLAIGTTIESMFKNLMPEHISLQDSSLMDLMLTHTQKKKLARA